MIMKSGSIFAQVREHEPRRKGRLIGGRLGSIQGNSQTGDRFALDYTRPMTEDTPLATRLEIRLPDWVSPLLVQEGRCFETREARMALAIRLASINTERETGGPFGAAVFEIGSGKLVSAGVNVVVPSHCSIAHAEMVAISLAQQALATNDLGGGGGDGFELVSSAEPCAMCLGAIPWSGVRSVVCGARDEDVRAVGFDEGSKPTAWPSQLEERGISIVRDVLRDEAAEVLREYLRNDRPIYNGRGGE